MKEIKWLGTMKYNNENKGHSRSIFLCPVCAKKVVRQRFDGIRAISCSVKCSLKVKKKKRNWKEKTSDGNYILIYKPDHPRLIGRKRKYVPEQILIMEKLIGRYLNNNEIVHHTNGDRKDNRIENLQLMTDKEHKSYHNRGSKQWKSKLTEKDVMEIRKRYNKGEHLKLIAKDYPILPHSIWNVIYGITWKHIPMEV